jgi:RNA polymerase sigma factor (sigma-70 family)
MDEQERFESLLPLARTTARKYERLYHEPYGAFLTYAYEGAWKAAKTWDRRKSLEGWGYLKIRGTVIDGARWEMAARGQTRREHTRKVEISVETPLPNYQVLGDTLICPRSEIYEKKTEDHDLLMRLKARMDEREWEVLTRCECNGETLKAVGESWGLTESRACQIMKLAKKHARSILSDMTSIAS